MSNETARRARVATGRLIKELRERRQLSQEQLANLTDLSRFTVERLEDGHQTLGLEHGRKLAAALGLPLDKLMAVVSGWRNKLLAEAQVLEDAARRLRELAAYPDA